LAKELGLDPVSLDSKAGLEIFSGNVTPEGSEPLAQGYAGISLVGLRLNLGMDERFSSAR
jgi:serine/tyrosine/threonine adenylyltransferase